MNCCWCGSVVEETGKVPTYHGGLEMAWECQVCMARAWQGVNGTEYASGRNRVASRSAASVEVPYGALFVPPGREVAA